MSGPASFDERTNREEKKFLHPSIHPSLAAAFLLLSSFVPCHLSRMMNELGEYTHTHLAMEWNLFRLVNGRITVVGGENDERKPMDDVEVCVVRECLLR